MAVATPVLERKVTAQEGSEERSATDRNYSMSQEELHNSRIRDNYARLINPNYKIEDYFVEPVETNQPTQAQQVINEGQTAIDTPQVQTYSAQPYLVENARADADIFRADSQINRVARQTVVENVASDEEENEDLRPTQTTIQYKTVEDKKEENVSSNKGALLNKKEKIIIAAFVSIVIVMFTLVIINSAIIANLNNDISVLQSGIDTVRGALAGVNSEIAAIVSPESIAQFAETHNLILK
jgi:cell division protein FtsL